MHFAKLALPLPSLLRCADLCPTTMGFAQASVSSQGATLRCPALDRRRTPHENEQRAFVPAVSVINRSDKEQARACPNAAQPVRATPRGASSVAWWASAPSSAPSSAAASDPTWTWGLSAVSFQRFARALSDPRSLVRLRLADAGQVGTKEAASVCSLPCGQDKSISMHALSLAFCSLKGVQGENGSSGGTSRKGES